jgi:hypothetical protein
MAGGIIPRPAAPVKAEAVDVQIHELEVRLDSSCIKVSLSSLVGADTAGDAARAEGCG